MNFRAYFRHLFEQPEKQVTARAAGGVIQFVIALVMLTDYRRAGIWGAG